MSVNYTATFISSEEIPFSRSGEGARLVVTDGADKGRVISVGAKPAVFGKSRTADVVLNDGTISRQHCSVTWEDDRLLVRDLDSKNGCFFHGTRFKELWLTVSQDFRMGSTTMKLVPNEEAVDPEEHESQHFGNLVGGSSAMRKLFTLIEQVAATDVPVLIEGETGTGKELIAEELHRRSQRAKASLGVFDCGAVPDDLIESALFGHIKGSFTGAVNNKNGIFLDSNGGTVFLDELGELKLELQPTLLRVLDKGTVRQVGASDYQEVDCRIVGATHRHLAQKVVDGDFREDLYYRIAVVRLSVPPLRKRREDIPLLVDHFLASKNRKDLKVDPTGLERAMEHSWPGNIRELRNAVDRAITFSNGDTMSLLDPATTPPVLPTRERMDPVESTSSSSEPSKPLTSESFRDAKAAAIHDLEREYLQELMKSHKTVSSAAAAAKMDRKHLKTLLTRHGIGTDD